MLQDWSLFWQRQHPYTSLLKACGKMWYGLKVELFGCVSGVDRTQNISTTSHKKPFKFLADSWIKGCAHLCNQLIMLICFFNWIVQVIGHIKGTKSWELFIVVLIFISQMLGILTRVSMLFISTVLNNKYSLSFNSYSIIGHENFVQPCYTFT